MSAITEEIVRRILALESVVEESGAGEIAGIFSAIRSVSSSPYNLTDEDGTVFVDASGGAITVNLPAAGTRGDRIYIVKRVNAGGANVTVAAAGADTIDDGVTGSVTIVTNTALRLQSDGASIWYLI